MRKFLLPAVFLIMVFSSCRQDQSQFAFYTLDVDPVYMDYSYFNPGTYWIYEDSASHAPDSVFVVSAGKTNYDSTNTLKEYSGYFGKFKVQTRSNYQQAPDNYPVDMQKYYPGGYTGVWHDKSVSGNYLGTESSFCC